jgi:hypothetical protein
MASNGEESERGFTIVDRRGEERGPEAPGAEAQTPAAPGPDDTGAGQAPLPPVDFASFLISLGTSALFHLGQVADPETGAPREPDLPVARHTIDTLELLAEKTRGNLTSEEDELLRNLLTDLRMRFVQASRAGGRAP